MDGEGEEERKPQFAYLDLLVSTLTEHEKALDRIIERLEGITQNLTEIAQHAKTTKTPPGEPESLVYIKMNIKRPIEEVKKILESLKE